MITKEKYKEFFIKSLVTAYRLEQEGLRLVELEEAGQTAMDQLTDEEIEECKKEAVQQMAMYVETDDTTRH
jgi:uncharacterized membrane protein YheB (UPF0754 family)